MRRLALMLALGCLALVACQGDTEPATSVTHNSATLHGIFKWTDGDGPGDSWYEYKTAAGSTWTETPHENFPVMPCSTAGSNACSSPDTAPPTLTGLQSSTAYVFRLCGWLDSDPARTRTCYDKNGTANGAQYDSFTTQASPSGFRPGIVANADHAKAIGIADTLNAPAMRVEFGPGTPTSSMDAEILNMSNRGIRPLLLAGTSLTPSAADASNMGNWAQRYGPGGTLGLPAVTAVQQIEFGNELSYANGLSGSWWADPSYVSRAQNYGLRVKQAADAVAAANAGVKVLAIAEDGGSANPSWVNNMYTGCACALHSFVGGWQIHPYGPRTRWEPKIDRLVSYTAAKGAPNTVPIDITEYGFSSRDGLPVSDNYGWPTNQTYQQAADALTQTVTDMRAKYGSRLRDFMLYSTYDLQPVSAGTNREWYFGAVKSDNSAKGAYTTAVRSFLGGQVVASARPFVSSSGLRTDAGRLVLRGVNVWGVPDTITNDVQVGGQSFWLQQYNARAQVVSQAKQWGANTIRLRVLADDYNGAPSANTDQRTRQDILNIIDGWRDAVVANDMYLIVTAWDALDGAFDDADWAGNGFRSHQLYTDMIAALGDDPRVMYEPWNEPNNVSWDAWQANMTAAISHFRNQGYRGALVIDPINWANSGGSGAGFDATRFQNILTHDRGLLGGSHQIMFAKHDYAQNWPSQTFNGATWRTASGINNPDFLIFESEFGNYNGSPSTVNPTWSSNAAAFFKAEDASSVNYAGGAAFLWGPWSDANSLTASDNSTPTSPWGTTVRDTFLP